VYFLYSILIICKVECKDMNNKEIISIFAIKFNKICEMNRSHIFGYLLGLLIFVIGIPALMRVFSSGSGQSCLC
jgi:hypothetical protein